MAHECVMECGQTISHYNDESASASEASTSPLVSLPAGTFLHADGPTRGLAVKIIRACGHKHAGAYAHAYTLRRMVCNQHLEPERRMSAQRLANYQIV